MNRVERYLVIGITIIGLLGVYALAGGLSIPGYAAAEGATVDNAPPRVITVQGQATVKVKPDTAAITLGIETQESTALAAQQANNQLMNQVVKALKAAGVTEDDLATSQFSIQPVYDYSNQRDPQTPPSIVGYRVSNILTVKTKKIDSVGSLIDTAARAGANRVQGISFFVEDPSTYQKQALKDAVADAREKAEILAAAAGTQIKDVISISEQGASTYNPPMYARSLADTGAAESTPIYSGDQTITVNVTVQYSH